MVEPNPWALSLVCGTAALAFAHTVWTCHERVFGRDYADFASWNEVLFEKHSEREGHRLVLARHGDIVTGYCWGYVGHRGEYWSDLLCESLPEPIASHWVGGHFDVVELAVLPEHRRQGLGQALHDGLLDGLTGRFLLGTSSDPDDPAVRLYTRSGWSTLGALRTGMRVMGLERT